MGAILDAVLAALRAVGHATEINAVAYAIVCTLAIMEAFKRHRRRHVYIGLTLIFLVAVFFTNEIARERMDHIWELQGLQTLTVVYLAVAMSIYAWRDWVGHR